GRDPHRGARARQGEAEPFHEESHGVPRRHLAAGTRGRAAAISHLLEQLFVSFSQMGCVFQLAQLLDYDLLPLHVADIPALVRGGDHLASPYEYERPVETDRGKHHAGYDLVAGADSHPAFTPAHPKGRFYRGE